MRSRSSPCRPVISASAMMSAITPTVTPSVETSEISDRNACLRRAEQVAEGDEEFEGHRTLIDAHASLAAASTGTG